MQRTRGKNGAERQTGQAVASTEAVRGKQNVRPRNPAYRAPVPTQNGTSGAAPRVSRCRCLEMLANRGARSAGDTVTLGAASPFRSGPRRRPDRKAPLQWEALALPGIGWKNGHQHIRGIGVWHGFLH